MNAETVVQTIQLVIAPTVMISSCTLIQNAILGRYSSIGDRLRVLVRERLDLLEKYDISQAVYRDHFTSSINNCCYCPDDIY